MSTSHFAYRSDRIDSFRAALFVTLGLTACGSSVIEEDGGGGSGGDQTGGSSVGGSSVGGSSVGGSSVGGSSVGGSSVGGSSVGGSSVGGGSVGGGPVNADCENPMPLIVEGKDTGFDICDGGQLLRREALDCPTPPPDPNSCCGTCPDGQICSDAGEVACLCVDSCTTDADCTAEQLCMCTSQGGTCTAASCNTAADCAAGEECTSWDASQGCLYLQFDCTTAQDTCGGDLDCAVGGEMCLMDVAGVRSCQPGGCAIGRPFLIEGCERVAPVVRSTAWCSHEQPALGQPEAARGLLADRWTVIGQMEHASVAAFARFTLQLLSLGAPADLVAASHQAMSDEIKHAKTAFAFASAFATRSIGPGALDIEHALDGGDLASVLRLTIREGCVGETVAALEAAEGASLALDPVVRAALLEVSRDEASHAELAWKFVRFALSSGGEAARSVLVDELRAIEAELGASLHTLAQGEIVAGSGLLTEGARASLREATLRGAVLPALRALVASSSTDTSDRTEEHRA